MFFQRRSKILIIIALVSLISLLHYLTGENEAFHHIVYREFYFLPIILAAFWFGLRGGLFTSLAITVLYVPFALSSFNGAKFHQFGNIMEVLFFNIVGVSLGWLRDREQIHQQALRKTEALASMGRAVSAVAHDMKTPLVAIGGFANQIKGKLQDEKLIKKIDIVLSQTSRLEALVKDMLAFARPLKLQKKSEDLNQLIIETMEVASEKARQQPVFLEKELQDNLPPVKFDWHKLQQALLNIVTNAIESSPDNETVGIRSTFHGKEVWVDISPKIGD